MTSALEGLGQSAVGSHRARTLRIGQMPYLNVAPFYFDIECLQPFEIIVDSPRRLGEMARRAEIDMAPLSLIDTFTLPDMVPLGGFAVACRGAVKSVLLFSRRPFEELGGATIGATVESVTSVRLVEVLLRRAGVTGYRLVAEDDGAADALLLIGDRALAEAQRGRWGFVTDLCDRWWRLEGLPFVFARWVVRKDAEDREAITTALAASLDRALAELPALLEKGRYPVDLAGARAYLLGFDYRPGPDGEAAIERFRGYLRSYAID